MKAVIYVLAAVLLAGCGFQKERDDSRLALLKTTNPEPIQIEKNGVSVENIRKEVEAIKEIYDAAVIKGDHNILVAYKVRHLDRFQMKKIEKNLKERLEKEYGQETFIVSSDYKIFLEAVRLREDIDSGKTNDKEADKRLHEIIKLKQERT
ncbi:MULTISPECIES: YhcN/YlaJ family sporulation lipoprotein [Bacillaceae]|uniref:YhcN/YlaJ family sporulation lipoprotein n=1 Tax=Bacillaceae TaxID=186817 RepID=UPI000E746044|nr:YhcN/YlaJ family sporulation lipoprotein [Bacillus sp. PK3_68]RJS61739.1 sporulation protein [Bacillus sp. PK3_68]